MRGQNLIDKFQSFRMKKPPFGGSRDNIKDAIYKSRINWFFVNISVSGEYIGNQNKVKEIQLFLGISCGLKQALYLSLILQGNFYFIVAFFI